MSGSLRQACTGLGLLGPVSLCRDVLGYNAGRLPIAPASRPRPDFSLSRFMQLLRGPHFHVQLIVAGSDLVTDNDQIVIDYAVYRLRDIYSTNGIGVGRVSRDLRTAANSNGHATVTTSAQIDSTGHDLTADGAFVPVALPANMNVSTMSPDGTVRFTLGKSPIAGPCTPRNRPDMNSAVVDINGQGTGRTLAHEVGHYLGASHPAAAANTLMTQTGSVPGDAFLATTITASERATMLAHCTVQPAIPGV